MERIIFFVKSILWIGGLFVSVVIFFHTLITLEPRMTKMEERQATTEERLTSGETRISMIEVKLDELLRQSGETHKDVRDIHNLMIKIHAK